MQEHLQSIYRIQAPDVNNFLIDKETVQQVMGENHRIADEWVLVQQEDDTINLAIYIASDHLARLSDVTSPMAAVVNHFSAFCAAIEGISHFLMLYERARREEPVTMLELEMQAEVDKYVCASLLRPQSRQQWHQRLFRMAMLADGLTLEETQRYREAGRLAAGFCISLDQLPHAAAQLHHLRSFWRSSGAQRMAAVRKLAA